MQHIVIRSSSIHVFCIVLHSSYVSERYYDDATWMDPKQKVLPLKSVENGESQVGYNLLKFDNAFNFYTPLNSQHTANTKQMLPTTYTYNHCPYIYPLLYNHILLIIVTQLILLEPASLSEFMD